MPRQKPVHTFRDVDLDDEVVIVNGERLTEAGAQAWAEELENRDRSRDRSLANLIPGRKSLSGNGKHSPVLSVRVSEDARRRLGELAERSGESVSRVARRAIDAYLADNE